MYSVSKFKNYLMANNFAKSSIINYTASVDKFIAFLNGRVIDEDNIIEYVLILRKTLSDKSINCHLDGLQCFLRYFKINVEIPKRKKTVEKVPKYFTYKFFRDSIIPMVELVSSKPIRDKALLYFLFFTGLRKGELVNLKRADFDLDKRTVKVFMPKVQKERITFFTSRVKNRLKDYFLFEAEDKNAFNIGLNTVSNLLRKLQPYFKKEVNLHPHLFRDSYAVHLLKQGIDISIVSTLLGHSNISSTMRYATLKTDDIKNIYDGKIK